MIYVNKHINKLYFGIKRTGELIKIEYLLILPLMSYERYSQKNPCEEFVITVIIFIKKEKETYKKNTLFSFNFINKSVLKRSNAY